jgi:hypothetical protein
VRESTFGIAAIEKVQSREIVPMKLGDIQPSLPVCLMVGLWLVTISGFALAEGAAAPALPEVSDLPLRIRELEHPEYAVRARATKALADAGAKALEPLTAALSSESLELRMRVVHLLGQIYSQGDEATFEQAESVLEKVRSVASGSLSDHAAQVLTSHFEIRQKFAADRIRKMGGSIQYRPEIPGAETGEDDELDGQKAENRIVDAVVVGQEWTGGDEGLKQIRRLSKLRVVYRISKAPVSDAAIEALQNDMPHVAIESRGPAYFGITPSSHPRGCVIVRLAPGSAADKAGIQLNDLITHFDGKPVENSDIFIDLIAGKLPGASVPVVLERNGQVMELKAELTGWPKDESP